MAKKRGPTMNQSQRDKFVDKARELGCDEEEAAFEKNLKRLAKAKPQPRKNEAPEWSKEEDKKC